MKRYIYWVIAFAIILGTLMFCYKKLGHNIIKNDTLFKNAQASAIANGQHLILIDAPNWCKDCVALNDLYNANYGGNIETVISSINGTRIKLKSSNCEDNPQQVNDLLSKCEIKNVPSLIIFSNNTFTVKTDISEIATTLFNATQQQINNKSTH